MSKTIDNVEVYNTLNNVVIMSIDLAQTKDGIVFNTIRSKENKEENNF